MEYKKIDSGLATLTTLIGVFALLPKLIEAFGSLKNNKLITNDNHPAPI